MPKGKDFHGKYINMQDNNLIHVWLVETLSGIGNDIIQQRGVELQVTNRVGRGPTPLT